MKLVVLITSRLEGGLEVAQGWQEGGAPGVTVLRSQGIHNLQKAVQRGDIELPRVVGSMAAAMAALIDNMEQNGLIALSVVDDTLVDQLVKLAQDALGDLYQQDNGILFVIPIERAYGVTSHRGE